MKKSEQRQQAILAYMRKMINDKGFPPTVRDIQSELGIKSTSTIHADIKELEKSGFLIKDPNKPRALKLTEDSSKTSAANQTFDDINTVTVPVVGRVAAGQPILSQENIEDEFPMPARFIGNGTNFILTVHGDSMVNIGINDGDYILVQEEQTANNGEIVVAMVNGEYESEATVKRFYRENGHIRLQPENDTMEPIIVDDVQIVGKVKGVFRYFN